MVLSDTMAGRWLRGLPSQKNMLNKNILNVQSDNNKALSEKKKFKKYIAAHDTKPLAILTTCGTTELIRHLELKKILDADEKKCNSSKLSKKRSAASSGGDDTFNKKQKTESMEFKGNTGSETNSKKRKR